MKRKNSEAARLETDYCNRVRSALHQRDATEIEEILQSVREHIEAECAEDAAEEIGAIQMKNVLEGLGPPEAYGVGDGVRATAGPALPTVATQLAAPAVSKLAIASVLCLPAGLAMGVLAGGLWHLIEGKPVVTDQAILAGIGTTGSIFLAGLLLGILALGVIKAHPGRLVGRQYAWSGIAVLPVSALMIFLFLARAESTPAPPLRKVPVTAPVTTPAPAPVPVPSTAPVPAPVIPPTSAPPQ